MNALSTESTKPSAASPSTPLGAWQARALHRITLPSGQVVRIKIPGVGSLLEKGDLPPDLLEVAYQELTAAGGATAELAREIKAATEAEDMDKAREHVRVYADFQRALVREAVVEMKVGDEDGTGEEVFVPITLTMEELRADALPEDDLGMIAEIVQRLRGYDARGVRIGVEPLDRWDGFRQAHGCPDQNCPGCEKLVAEFSSLDVGAM